MFCHRQNPSPYQCNRKYPEAEGKRYQIEITQFYQGNKGLKFFGYQTISTACLKASNERHFSIGA